MLVTVSFHDSFHACASVVPPLLLFFHFLNLNVADSSEEKPCGKLRLLDYF